MRIDSLCAQLKSVESRFNNRNIHAADEADNIGFSHAARRHAEQIRGVFQLWNYRGDVGLLLHIAGDHGEFGVGILGCDLFDTIAELIAVANDEVVTLVGKVAQRRNVIGTLFVTWCAVSAPNSFLMASSPSLASWFQPWSLMSPGVSSATFIVLPLRVPAVLVAVGSRVIGWPSAGRSLPDKDPAANDSADGAGK